MLPSHAGRTGFLTWTNAQFAMVHLFLFLYASFANSWWWRDVTWPQFVACLAVAPQAAVAIGQLASGAGAFLFTAGPVDRVWPLSPTPAGHVR